TNLLRSHLIFNMGDKATAHVWPFKALALCVTCGLTLFGQAPQFEIAHSLPIGEALPNAFAVASVDVNQDGRPDLLVTAANGVNIFINREEGGFGTGTTIPLPADCGAANLRAADFDGDGIPDLAAYCFQTGTLQIYRGDGAGTFISTVQIAMSGHNAQAR